MMAFLLSRSKVFVKIVKEEALTEEEAVRDDEVALGGRFHIYQRRVSDGRPADSHSDIPRCPKDDGEKDEILFPKDDGKKTKLSIKLKLPCGHSFEMKKVIQKQVERTKFLCNRRRRRHRSYCQKTR